MAAALAAGPDDEVLEVGAGAGTLTVALARTARRVVAVEIDRRLLHALRSVTRDLPNVEVVEGDVLKLDLARLFPAGGHLVAGNIPYYLTGALLPRLLEQEPKPRRLALVVQKEVAERWTGAGGSSLSTLSVQVFAKPRLELVLPAGAFDPPPRVESALAVLEVREKPAVDLPDLHAFFRFAERIFQFRRKQLAPVMARVTGRSGEEVARELGRLEIDPSRRAETLSLAEWERLAGTDWG